MFHFKLEPELALLTAKRAGAWSLDTVVAYELALRVELAKLRLLGRPTSFIIDIRSSGAQAPPVAEALRAMVARLGPLHADRTAVVTSSGFAKLQDRRLGNPQAEVFTSMVLARDWVAGKRQPARPAGVAIDEPSVAQAVGPVVHVQGPSDVDVTLTPAAALETARRISDAARNALLKTPLRREKVELG